MIFICPFVLGIIIIVPIDEVIFFTGVGIPPTSRGWQETYLKGKWKGREDYLCKAKIGFTNLTVFIFHQRNLKTLEFV